MPDEIEPETKDLQEAISELHEEREERRKEEKETEWTRYIALSTAFLAVFAAIAALQSGSLANEAMISQLRASDTWNEYEADRQKEHLYTVQANSLLDSGVRPDNSHAATAKSGPWSQLPPSARLAQYVGDVQKETASESRLSRSARRLEQLAERQLDRHDRFARAVALIQVAIALAAVASLVKSKPIWYVSVAAGAIGIVLFALGFI